MTENAGESVMNQKLLLVGTMVPAEYETGISALSNASNRFLMNLTGVLQKCGHPIETVSYIGIPVPQDVKDALTKEGGYVFKTPGILGGVIRCHRDIRRALKSCGCLIAYNVVYGWLFAPLIAHAAGKKAILILADYSDVESVSSLKARLYARIQKMLIRRFDAVIGLSENVSRILRDGQSFQCMEGGISRQVYDYFAEPAEKPADGSITFMYAGILEKVTGIDLLLEAFSQLQGHRFRLCISGKGSMEDLVHKAAKQDRRIEYLGCPAYEIYLQNLKKADVLVNPRNMNLPENRNNFPSKIMEYLAAGKPVISTRFPGWERFEKEILFCDPAPEALKQQMTAAAETADPAQVFVRNRAKAEEYLWERQAEKVQRAIG